MESLSSPLPNTLVGAVNLTKGLVQAIADLETSFSKHLFENGTNQQLGSKLAIKN